MKQRRSTFSWLPCYGNFLRGHGRPFQASFSVASRTNQFGFEQKIGAILGKPWSDPIIFLLYVSHRHYVCWGKESKADGSSSTATAVISSCCFALPIYCITALMSVATILSAPVGLLLTIVRRRSSPYSLPS